VTNEDFILIARDLEQYHGIFSKIWQIGKPHFTEDIPTAAVSFNKDGQYIDFQFNPKFWAKSSHYERLFIICHECLHVILNHGLRLAGLNPELGNIAADVVINEGLVSNLGFDRSRLGSLNKKGCWLNTVFTGEDVEPAKSMEYYYNLLKEDILQKLATGQLVLIDQHAGLSGIDVSGLVDSLNPSDKESLGRLFQAIKDETEACESVSAGSVAGSLAITIRLDKVQVKRKWETVIKKWALKSMKESDREVSQWTRVNRRFAAITSDLILPTEVVIEDTNDEQDKIKVVFFQDTSGSCHGFAKRFFAAAKSLPQDRFDIELYCFDTRVYKTSLESGKLYGFGGTSFDILERYVMTQIAKNDSRQYPKAIFVITDGYGNKINPIKPKNWYWFLSSSYKSCIPDACNIFQLRDFE